MFNNVEYLQDFIDDLPLGIARLDTTQKLPPYYNTYFNTIFGWELPDIDTLDKWFLKAYPNEEYRKDIKKLWEVTIEETEKQNKSHSEPVELEVTCKDGSKKWCEARYYRKKTFVYATFIDVTHRKEVECKLTELSIKDPLTQIYNRRYFNLTFYDRWNIAQRHKTSISLIICDVDNFKTINDTKGHLVGDQVLKSIAKSIKDSLKRATDFVARFGGEEFVIVSCGGDDHSSIQLCQMIQKNALSSKFDGIADITLSYGIYSIFPDESLTPQEFINNADKALYEAKNSGKNKIVVFSS